MARVGYKYYIVVNNSTGRIDNECVECRLVRSSTSQPTPATDDSHWLKDISKTDYNVMLESRRCNGNFMNKWDNVQGEPVEDVAEDDVAEDENLN